MQKTLEGKEKKSLRRKVANNEAPCLAVQLSFAPPSPPCTRARAQKVKQSNRQIVKHYW
ncbi:MAG: hypothetical protein ACJATN_001251 [Neolewinella sp.]|jgi:hypothetical protein